MKILITGSSGNIGSSLIKHLYDNHKDIIVHGLDKEKPKTNILTVFYDCDITDHRDLNIDRDHYDAVVHLASVKSESANKCFKTNIFGVTNIISNIKTDCFLYIADSDMDNMKDPYSISKYYGHLAAMELCLEKNIKYSMLIPSEEFYCDQIIRSLLEM